MIIHEYLESKLTDSFEVEFLEEENRGFLFETWRGPAGGLLHVYKLSGDDRNLACEEIGFRDEGDKRIFIYRATFF